MTLTHKHDALGRISLSEPDQGDRAVFLARKVVPYERAIRELWAAAEHLHRLYDQSAHHGTTLAGRMNIEEAEREYDLCRTRLARLRIPTSARY